MRLKLSIILLVIVAALSGCNDSEPERFMPLDDIIGLWDDEYVNIMVNGKKFLPLQGYPWTVTWILGEVQENQTEATLTLASHALSFLNEDPPGKRDFLGIGVQIDCKSVSKDKIIFYGTSDIPITGFFIEVNGTITGEGDRRDLNIDITYRQLSDILVGRTFEIDFTDESVYPEIDPEAEYFDPSSHRGLHLSLPPDLIYIPDHISRAFDNIKDTYVNKVGCDRARIRFNDDLSYTLWFRDTSTGEYSQVEADLHYYYNDTDIFFIDPESFVKSFVPLFDFWGVPRIGMMFHQYVIDYRNKWYSVLGMFYELSGDKLILTYRDPRSFAGGFCNNDGMPTYWYVLGLMDKYFTAKAVFTEVK